MSIRKRGIARAAGLFAAAMTLAVAVAPAFAGDQGNVLRANSTVATITSTVPANGDVNPYGVFRVPVSTGKLVAGHILVSDFNNASNLQGTGTTIVDVSPAGSLSLFAQIDASKLPGPCPGGVGLTTALVVLRTGWVIVGSLPTSDGTSATAQAGCLIVLDRWGNAVETFQGSLINGPWDATVADGDDRAELFVTNVLNGTLAASTNPAVPGSVVNQGTVLRINLRVSESRMPWIESITVIGSGFSERTDPAALVIGPTGVGLSRACDDEDSRDCSTSAERGAGPLLYVADSLNNRIQAIPNALTRSTTAGTGTTFSWGGSLNDPLGLAVSRSGHVLTVNGDDGFITEINQRGTQVAKLLLDNTGTPPGNGTLFGLAFDSEGQIVFVDDGSNTLNMIR